MTVQREMGAMQKENFLLSLRKTFSFPSYKICFTSDQDIQRPVIFFINFTFFVLDLKKKVKSTNKKLGLEILTMAVYFRDFSINECINL